MQFREDLNELNLCSFETICLLEASQKHELEIEHLQIRDKSTNQVYLLKKMTKPRNPRVLQSILKEFNILRQINHPNIVKAYSSKETDNQLYLLYEFTSRDLKNQYRVISQQQSAIIILQIADALEYLHTKSMLHRNINLSNITIQGSGLNIKAKLKDFQYVGSMMCSGGTKPQMIDSLAPQILDNQIQNEKVDVWGLGVLIYTLYCKNHPFLGNGKMSYEFTRQSIKKCIVVYPQTIPQPIKHILQKVFLFNPLLRLTITQIISNEYFREYRQKLQQIRQKQHLQQKVIELQRQLSQMKSSQYKSKQLNELQRKLKFLQDQYKSALQSHDVQRHKLKQTQVKCIKLQKQKRSVLQYRMNLQKSKLQLTKINNNIIMIVQQNQKIAIRNRQLQNELNSLKVSNINRDYDKMERPKSNKSSSSISKYIINQKFKELRSGKLSPRGKMPPLSHSKSSKILF